MNLPFRQVWACDFEFHARPGSNPDPICMVATELRSGTTVRLWQDELRSRRLPPFSTGPDTLFVAYYASAELGCFLELGWPTPERILDLFAEYRNLTNGRGLPNGNGLIGALATYGLDSIASTDKDEMRQLAIRGGPWTDQERRGLLDYCQTDVDALARLLPLMLLSIDLPRALLRGRYMAAAARIERTGIPIEPTLRTRIVDAWDDIKAALVGELDAEFGVFEGLSFKVSRFADYLVRHDIPWPRLPSGQLDLQDETFREMVRSYPTLQPLRELRGSLSKLRLRDLAVGPDQRNRVLLGAYGAKSGRNAPRSGQFVFGPSAWVRSLIQPSPGRAVAYVDWSQQEFGIAAALSGDPAMLESYSSGDPYLSFAKRAGAAPAKATKATHPHVREQYKATVLGVQYGMGPQLLADRIGQPLIVARNLLRDHRSVFSRFWEWNDAAADRFSLTSQLSTVFGWTLHQGPTTTERTARNFPMQGNGAEMMRLAACYLTEAGIEVCAPVHDAFLIEADQADADDTVRETQRLMRKASADVLSGFELGSDAAIYRYPERYSDDRGKRMFETVCKLTETRPPAGYTVSPADDSSSFNISYNVSINNINGGA